MKNKITTILQTYKRPEALQEQIEAIRKQTVGVSEIWVCHNQPDTPVKFNYPNDVFVIDSQKNFKYHLRFAIGLLAQTEYVAIFDDDTIPGPRWYENCLKYIEKQDGLYGTIGVRCLNGGYLQKRKLGWGITNEKLEEVDLVGHSWFLRSKNLKYLWFEDPINYENGEDIQLSYSLQKYANLKTFVPPHPKDNKALWGSVKGQSFQDPNVASYKANGEKAWYIERDRIVRECVKRGWKLWEVREAKIRRKK